MPIQVVDTGTITVTNGSKIVVGDGTFWTSDNTKNADTIWIEGFGEFWIDSLNEADQEITLYQNYTGPNDSGLAYAIKPTSPEWVQNITLTQHLVQLIGSLDEQVAVFPSLAREANASIHAVTNLGVVVSVGAGAMTFGIRQADAITAPDADNPATVTFRSSTAAIGAFEMLEITSAIGLVVPSGATLGQSNATAARPYLYAINFGGTVELAVAGYDAGDTGVVSTTAIDTGADSASVFYSTTARAGVSFRKLAALPNTQTIAGTWAAVPSPLVLEPVKEAETAAFKTLKAQATAGALLTALGISAFAQTMLDDAAATDVLSTLGVSTFIKTLLDDAAASNARTTLGVGSGDSPAFAGLALGSGAVISWNAGDVTATHSANQITFAGASSGYTFGNVVNLNASVGATLGTFSSSGASVGTALTINNLAFSTTGTGTVFPLAFYNANGLVGNVNFAGTTTNYVTSSDKDKKIDEGLLDPAVAIKILRLMEVHNFTWRSSGEKAIGMFAQDLYEIYPQAVSVGGWFERTRLEEKLDPATGKVMMALQGRVERKDKKTGKVVVDAEGEMLPVMEMLEFLEYIPWGIDYSKLAIVLTVALQDIDRRLVKLEGGEYKVPARPKAKKRKVAYYEAPKAPSKPARAPRRRRAS